VLERHGPLLCELPKHAVHGFCLVKAVLVMRVVVKLVVKLVVVVVVVVVWSLRFQ
jgi:hypothetical protein